MIYQLTGSFIGGFLAYTLMITYYNEKKIKKIYGISLEYLITFFGSLIGGFYGHLFCKYK